MFSVFGYRRTVQRTVLFAFAMRYANIAKNTNIWRNWKPIKEFFEELWKALLKWLEEAFGIVKQKTDELITAVNKLFTSNPLEEGVFRTKKAQVLAKAYDRAAKAVKDFEETIKLRQYEHAAIFKDGKKAEEITSGLEGRVKFTYAHASSMKGAVVTHNHPLGGSLSDSEILSFLRNEPKELRAVCPDGTVFSLKNKGLKMNHTEVDDLVRKADDFVKSTYPKINSADAVNIRRRLMSEELMKRLLEGYGNEIEYIKYH